MSIFMTHFFLGQGFKDNLSHMIHTIIVMNLKPYNLTNNDCLVLMNVNKVKTIISNYFKTLPKLIIDRNTFYHIYSPAK